jgi:hypothetical protein
LTQQYILKKRITSLKVGFKITEAVYNEDRKEWWYQFEIPAPDGGRYALSMPESDLTKPPFAVGDKVKCRSLVGYPGGIVKSLQLGKDGQVSYGFQPDDLIMLPRTYLTKIRAC